MESSNIPKRLYKRFVPSHHHFREHKRLRIFGHWLHDPNLWHLNRRSAAGAMGVGMFIAFIPTPGQMLIAAAAAVWLRINLPLTVVMVWITNPITMPPIFFFTYKVGAWLLGIKPYPFAFDLSLAWLVNRAEIIGIPLLIGSLFVGSIAGGLTYVAVRLAWRLAVTRRRRNRSVRNA